jgi:2-polyprenyl-3-methyl-5-hydroxy-6-metoxy-1,4-benzoquinol methylase
MKFTERIPKELIKEDHFLGRPADFGDKIIKRRIQILKKYPIFFNQKYELLDIGCGNGASMFLLSNDMKSCLGIDVEEFHVEEFLKFKNQYKIKNCDLKVLDFEKSSLSKQFDRIISFEVIEHLVDDNNVTKYYNALKEDGVIAISVPNKWWIFETHGAKLPLLPWNRVPFFSWLPRPIHERYANARIYTRKRIVNLLKKNGFKIIDIKYVTAPLDVLSESKIKRLLTRFIFHSDTTKNPFIATSIFVIAQK